jgi:hypothetical protein
VPLVSDDLDAPDPLSMLPEVDALDEEEAALHLLLDDAEREMRYTRGFDHPGAFQFDRLGAQVVKQSDTPSEQNGNQVDVYLVEQSGPYALLRDASGAYGDVLVLRDRSCLFDGALYAVRDERKRRSFVDPFLGDRVSDDEGRYAQGGSATPPVCDVERPPSRH